MKILSRLKSSAGWTLPEMVIVVAVVLILLGIVAASYDTLRARARYAKLSGDMDGIAQAAYNDFTTHSDWAPDAVPGSPPAFVSGNELTEWPTPPCPGWVYSWDNWIGLPSNAVRVTVRRADFTAIYSYCVQTLDSNCTAPDFYGGSPANLETLDNPYIYCNE